MRLKGISMPIEDSAFALYAITASILWFVIFHLDRNGRLM